MYASTQTVQESSSYIQFYLTIITVKPMIGILRLEAKLYLSMLGIKSLFCYDIKNFQISIDM